MRDRIYYPLTSPQMSIWYTERMYPGTSIANVAGTLRIKHFIDISLLERAINLFIRNNDGIRLRITLDEEGNPRQYVSEYQYEKIEVLDFSMMEDPVKAMQQWDAEETAKPFEILDDALYRFAILKLSDKDAGIFLNTHHIISDAWSMLLFGNSMINYYSKLLNNQTQAIKDSMPSYTSFINNEKNYLNSARYQKDKDYWEHKFEAPPEMTALKYKKTNKLSIRSKRKTFVPPAKFTNKLREYCSEHKISPYQLFVSALAMYINRVTEKDDIIIGTPILNRLNQADKNTVGMFISTVPLRISINSEQTFASFSRSILELCSHAYRHQRYPYDHILKYVREKYDFKDNIYDIVLSYQNSKINNETDINYSSRWHFNGYQPNSLSIHINDRDNEGILIIDYDYQSDLYYDKEIEFIHRHMLSLLWHALDNPGKTICKIDMLPENEKKKILMDFNNTDADYPRDRTIHQLFEEQAERTPNNTALIFEDKKLTYRELNEKANSLARVLRRKGVKPDSIVGVLVHRSQELIIGILAVLKAGGSYLPIEPSYPDDRINFIIKDSGMEVILTDAETAARVSGCESVDITDKTCYGYSGKNLKNMAKSNNLAYTIYTSGSTGEPKGVMVEHNSVINFIYAVSEIMDFSENSIVLSATTICFDIFVFEVFTSLLKGSAIVLANEQEQKVPHLTSALIKRHQVNKILTTPSKMSLLISDKKNFKDIESLREIMLGGEVFPLELLKKLKENTNAKIINGYGPTETTIGVSFKELVDYSRITVGKPISNTKLYILDKHLNLLPIGVPGELFIGGACLSRGYLNRNELTAKSFIQSPFNPGEKLYKTGDIAKWYPKGEVDLLGRKDNQVKINGYRIELEEIKNQILRINEIDEAIVINQTVKNNRQVLCAYLVAGERKPSVAQIRQHLSRVLPEYMIPSYIQYIPGIPVTGNGKIDVKKLPSPLISKRKEIYVMPKNDTEREVQKIWEKVLNIRNISVNDVIFEIGGDSMDVISISTMIHKKFNIEIPITEIKEVNSIRKMAQYIDQKKSAGFRSAQQLCLLKRGKKNLFFIHAGNGEISNYIELSQKIDDEFACWGIRMDFDEYYPCSLSIHDLANSYVKIIKRVQADGPYYLAGWSIGGTIAFEMSCILEKGNDDVKFLGLIDSIEPKNWGNIGHFITFWELRPLRFKP